MVGSLFGAGSFSTPMPAVVDWIIGTKFPINLHQNTTTFIQEDQSVKKSPEKWRPFFLGLDVLIRFCYLGIS